MVVLWCMKWKLISLSSKHPPLSDISRTKHASQDSSVAILSTSTTNQTYCEIDKSNLSRQVVPNCRVHLTAEVRLIEIGPSPTIGSCSRITKILLSTSITPRNHAAHGQQEIYHHNLLQFAHADPNVPRCFATSLQCCRVRYVEHLAICRNASEHVPGFTTLNLVCWWRLTRSTTANYKKDNIQ